MFVAKGFGLPWAFSLLSLTLLVCSGGSAAAEDSVLKAYVNKEDPSYKWEIVETQEVEGVTVHQVLLTSQTWMDITWRHHLSIIVPKESKETGHALLFVSGGGIGDDGMPRMKKDRDGELRAIGQIAVQTGAPVAVLRQVPNQPLYGGKVEDELIAYTYNEFLKSGNKDWPLLLPMANSAVKAMDAVQEILKEKSGPAVEKFVISGASKRGWTTWLTAATGDTRVAAIAPMVIDTLNFAKQMPYQVETWGHYSEQIEDYTRLGIQDKMSTEEGATLNSIVDPYSYLDAYQMPKLLFMGTNDPYWTVDAVKFYYDDLPGVKGIHYVANAGHGLKEDQAVKNLAAFFATVASGKKHPVVEWETSVADGNLVLKASANVDATEGRIWTAEQADRDFRDAEWTNKSIDEGTARGVTVKLPLPKEGYKAVYLEAFFPSPTGGSCSKCTRILLMDSKGLL